MAIVHLTLTSNILNMNTEIMVYLPETHRGEEKMQPDRKYPVIYCLHGYKESYTSWITKSTLLMECRKHECIVVMPDGRNSFYSDGKNGFNYYDFITKELPIKIANFFPASTKREDTFIMGASMGGYGAFMIAMNNPQQYAAAYSFSAPLSLCYKDGVIFKSQETMQKQVMGAFGNQQDFENSRYDIFALAKRLDAYKQEKPRLKAICGKEDVLCFQENEMFIEKIRKYTSLNVEYEVGSGEHDYFFWNKYIDNAFKFFNL